MTPVASRTSRPTLSLVKLVAAEKITFNDKWSFGDQSVRDIVASLTVKKQIRPALHTGLCQVVRCRARGRRYKQKAA